MNETNTDTGKIDEEATRHKCGLKCTCTMQASKPEFTDKEKEYLAKLAAKGIKL